MFEGLPTNPDPGRYWDMVQRHRITSFYTASTAIYNPKPSPNPSPNHEPSPSPSPGPHPNQAPTAIRALMKFGTEHVKKYDKSSLRVLGSVGEHISPEATPTPTPTPTPKP